MIFYTSVGNEVVDWLHQRVEGFSDRKDARKYAAQLLKSGLIKHTVNKRDFSEQCYYVFGDFCDSLAALKLDGEDSISDLGLPPPSATSQWGSNMGSVAPHLPGANFPPSTVAVGGYMQPHQPPNFNYTNESYMFNRDSGSGGSSSGTAKKASQHRSPLQSGGSDSEAASQITASSVRLPPAMSGGGGGGVPTMVSAPPQQLLMHHHHHHYQPRPPPPLPHQPLPPIPSNMTAHPPMTNASSQLMTNTSSSSPLVPPSNGSCASSGGAGGAGGGSSGSERSHGAAGPPNTGLSSSMASFSRAMANPCDYFIDSV
ncbi:DEP domain [Trinorchestia longiramus]|nr:DEP domain [Trinorchestia longiramus]